MPDKKIRKHKHKDKRKKRHKHYISDEDVDESVDEVECGPILPPDYPISSDTSSNHITTIKPVVHRKRVHEHSNDIKIPSKYRKVKHKKSKKKHKVG